MAVRLSFVPIFAFFCISGCFSSTRTEIKPLTREQIDFSASLALIQEINALNTTWVAGLNPRFHDLVHQETHHFSGCVVRNPKNSRVTSSKRRLLGSEQLPENFDARQQWSQCRSISEVRDQSNCGSCWAFGATEVMSDRICIASNGKHQPHISADDLLSCCSSCGYGCDGGDPSAAFEFWVRHGLVTGGNYTSAAGCKPYPFPPCEHHVDKGRFGPCPHGLQPTPRCRTSCQSGYNVTYAQDKYFGKSAYRISTDVESIQREIFTNGPVEVAFTVYEDFEHYQSGVYSHVRGSDLGGHAVRMLGWGVDKASGVPYWLCANSWNQDWGEAGLFRIRRGKNECGIEQDVQAGLPRLNDVRAQFGRPSQNFVDE